MEKNKPPLSWDKQFPMGIIAVAGTFKPVVMDPDEFEKRFGPIICSFTVKECRNGG